MSGIKLPGETLRSIFGSYPAWVGKFYFAFAILSAFLVLVVDLSFLNGLPFGLPIIASSLMALSAISLIWLGIAEIVVRGLNKWASKRGLDNVNG